MFRRSADLEEFLGATDSCCFVGDSFVAWQSSQALRGVTVWGDSDESNFEQRCKIMDYYTVPGSPRMQLLIDNAHCTEISHVNYERVRNFWESRRDRHAAVIDHIAVVVPRGLVGAIIAGLTALVDVGVKVHLFADVEGALRWLGGESALALSLELQSFYPPQREDTLLCSLQRMLSDARFSIDLQLAARRLGMSERTLQRRLSLFGTTFQAQLSHARLRMAKSLMLANNLNITAIALELGFSSLQHFSARFKDEFGVPPSRWLRSTLETSVRRDDVRSTGSRQ